MPANLTPEYRAAEESFRQAKTDEERLACLQEMLRTIPKHKGTEKMQGDIKRRISKLKQKEESARKSRRRGSTHRLRREGAGAIALVGAPNVGKSQLLAALTRAEPEVAPYPFTTQNEYPAIMPYEDIQIQLVDLPPVAEEHTEYWVLDIIKACDGMLFLVDLQADDPVEQYEKTLEVLGEFHIRPVPPTEEGERGFRETRVKAWILATKCDGEEEDELLRLFQETVSTDLPILPISVVKERNLVRLREEIFRMLDIIRVYSKPRGKDPDMSAPFTLPRESTVAELAEMVHKDFAEQVKFARLWGASKFDGQQVGREHVLREGDIVELHI
jgi:ribosome-interacting GTPase 1